MSSPFTITRLVRWRIKDWVSCFYACRFPLEEEKDIYCAMSPQKPSRNMVFDPIGDHNRKKNRKKLKKKMEKRKEFVEISAEGKAEEGGNDSSWPRFSEEDYIVFCFEDDGGIHIVEDKKSEKFQQKIDHVNLSPRPVCRKGERKGSNDMEEEWPPAVDKEISHIGDVSESKTSPSAESSESNDHSNGSTGSFAFPVLGWDWMGSPAQMPKPEEGPRYEKHKAWTCVRHPCCRF
ncbi:protein BREAKING OF ASYMMETRY IN THE STOMATAL LINEAGE-like isoform X3 [Nicotiana tabacum]|uniref:Protein BREAKING OF ASYMMETRY IN THE STOMATAL LINEAGE-like isoform X3 n=2 Tax=Nicotiana TaxID=4085 RepID=A0A1S4BW92_TOBAC|nr:PREDICTED: protein BREAKING OF ASYMMETRY IN THE STOMATAL LINEAGE isoform X4 [Nicotiana sylvestris]XP_016493147.1 PREDICTED: protein BREAKING OF ASYMMETRY IN THE STOMATAL LINEAGE-like isoform X4 [Nicotiana tabacum]